MRRQLAELQQKMQQMEQAAPAAQGGNVNVVNVSVPDSGSSLLQQQTKRIRTRLSSI